MEQIEIERTQRNERNALLTGEQFQNELDRLLEANTQFKEFWHKYLGGQVEAEYAKTELISAVKEGRDYRVLKDVLKKIQDSENKLNQMELSRLQTHIRNINDFLQKYSIASIAVDLETGANRVEDIIRIALHAALWENSIPEGQD